jgi:16S rRNA (uracil1498-N3)-methyltransferase
VARLTGPLRHYLCHVLRMRLGVPLELVDGVGGVYHGTVTGISAREVVVALTRRPPETPEPTPRLVLVYGLSRRSRTEWVLQKATELGVDWIVPTLCQRSVSRPAQAERKLQRWLEIIRQATRQCGRATMPLLSPPLPLAAALAETCETECRLVAAPGGPPLASLQETLTPATRSVAIAVGPEGGFSDEELAQATAAGFSPARLGPHVLRTETAAVVALALVAFLGGRLGG